MCATDLMRLHGQHRTESQLAQVRPAAGSGICGSSKLKSCLPPNKPCSSICNFAAWHKHRLGIGTGMNSKKRARVFHVHIYIPHPVNLSSRHVVPCGLSREVLANVKHEWKRHVCVVVLNTNARPTGNNNHRRHNPNVRHRSDPAARSASDEIAARASKTCCG